MVFKVIAAHRRLVGMGVVLLDGNVLAVKQLNKTVHALFGGYQEVNIIDQDIGVVDTGLSQGESVTNTAQTDVDSEGSIVHPALETGGVSINPGGISNGGSSHNGGLISHNDGTAHIGNMNGGSSNMSAGSNGGSSHDGITLGNGGVDEKKKSSGYNKVVGVLDFSKFKKDPSQVAAANHGIPSISVRPLQREAARVIPPTKLIPSTVNSVKSSITSNGL
jgi:hypothetical protein